MDSFKPETVSAFINESVDARYIGELLREYIEWHKNCPGAPEPSDLKPEDARAVVEKKSFNLAEDKDWATYTKRKRSEIETERQDQNPFLPRWFSKADGKPNVWMSDSGALTSQTKIKIRDLCRWNTPNLTEDINDLLDIPPTPETDLLGSILDSMTRYQPYFVTPMGDAESDFQWSRTLTTLAGLGATAVRVLMQDVAETTEEADPAHYASCTDEELKSEILNAQSICGYPIGLYRVPFTELDHILRSETQLTATPLWYPSVQLLHYLRHARFHATYKGKPFIAVAFRGAMTMIPVPEDGVFQSLASPVNQEVTRTLCTYLQIDRGGNKRNKTIFDIMSANLLNYITPEWLPQPVDLRARPEIIVPPSIQVSMALERPADKKWIDTGIKIGGMATVNLDTGEVNKKAYMTGELAGALNWPMSLCTAGALKNWYALLPDVAEPMLPSETLAKYIHNVNDLGMPKAQRAMLNAIVLMDLMREDLYGSPIGRLMINEFPLFTIQPSGHNLDDTTNQGKTNTARIIAGAMVPGIQVTQISRSASAPSQRAAASPLEQWGTAIYDEFVPVSSHDHFLSQAGLQALATGAGVTPGRALENARPIFLQHPLVFTLKLNKFPPDVHNRQFKLFLDALNSTNSATAEELDFIMSGQAALNMRLSALLWIRKNNFVEVARAAKIVKSKWRFDAHMSMAVLLGATVEEVEAYLEKSQEFTDHQIEEGSELAEDIGLDTLVNIQRLFEECAPDYLDQLIISTEGTKGEIRPFDFLKTIVENGTKRNIERYLNNIHRSEESVLQYLHRMLKRGDLKRDGYTLHKVSREKSEIRDRNRNKRSYLELIKDKDFVNPGTAGMVLDAKKKEEQHKQEEIDKQKKLDDKK